MTLFIFAIIKEQPYSMALPKLGHAVIINNIASEMPGSNEDVKALKEAYETVGFEVQVHENCTAKVWMNCQKTHAVKKHSFDLTLVKLNLIFFLIHPWYNFLELCVFFLNSTNEWRENEMNFICQTLVHKENY